MLTPEEKEKLIHDNIEGKMSLDESIAFAEMVEADPEMKKSYELSLLLYALADNTSKAKPEEIPEIAFESADSHIARVSAELENNPNQAKVFTLRSLVAVAAILFAMVAGIWLWYNNSNKENNLAKNLPNRKADSLKNDNSNLNNSHSNESEKSAGSGRLIAMNELAKNYYQLHTFSTEEPVEFQGVHKETEKGHFKDVITIQPEDFAVKGDASGNQVANYLALYKAISYFNLDKADKAISILKNDIHLLPKQKNELYYEQQWYLLLSYLKLGDKSKAESKLIELQQMKSHPRKKQIAEITAKLKNIP